MNPDFLKYLQQITSALRGGLVFNPLDELQKRAQQFGEGVGTDIEQKQAQAGYARAHPESQRAQNEMLMNAIKTYGSMANPEALGEKPVLTAAIKTPTGIVEGSTHGEAYAKAGIYDPLPPRSEGFVDQTGKYYTRQAAERLLKPWLSPAVKAQVAERAQRVGTTGLVSEDVKGKLYNSFGKADEPMTEADLNRIMAQKNKGAFARPADARQGGGVFDTEQPGGLVALDAHEKKAIFQAAMSDPALAKLLQKIAPSDLKKGQVPIRNVHEYKALSSIYNDIGKSMGLPSGRTAQAGRWLGGWDKTGLRTQPQGDFVQLLEDAILNSAKQRGLPTDPKSLREYWGRVTRGEDFIIPNKEK